MPEPISSPTLEDEADEDEGEDETEVAEPNNESRETELPKEQPYRSEQPLDINPRSLLDELEDDEEGEFT